MKSINAKTGMILGLLAGGALIVYLSATGVFGGTFIGLTLQSNTDLENGLVGHWSFDAGDVSGFTVSDSSGNGNDGSIIATSTTASSVAIDTTNVIAGAAILAGDHRIVWVDDQEGYVFYVRQSGTEPVVASTTDGGATWGNNFDLDGAFDSSTYDISVWFDRWTPGDAAGNIIHILIQYSTGGDNYYIEYDIGANTFSYPALTTDQGITASTINGSTITKAEDGKLYVAANDGSDRFVAQCSSNCTDTNNWSEISNPFSGFSNNKHGMARLLPIKDTDNVMLVLAYTSSNLMRSTVYSATSSSWWPVQEIGFMESNTTAYANMLSVASDKNTGDMYITYIQDSDDYTTEDHDLEFGRYSISTHDWATSTIAEDVSGGLVNVAITVDQNKTGHVYIAYARRTTIGTANTARVYYRESFDNGVTWSAELGPVDGGAEDYAGLSMPPSSIERVNIMWRESDADDLYYKSIKDIGDYPEDKVASAKLGQGMEFDGVDDYVETGESSDFDIFGTSPLTVSTWVKLHTSPIAGENSSLVTFTESGQFSGSSDKSIEIDENRIPRFWIYDGSIDVSTGPALNLNEWYHLVGTFDGTTVYLYVNGVQQTGVASGGSTNYGTPEVVFSYYRNTDQWEDYFDGNIDDVRIYDRALSAEEILRLYGLGATTKVGKTITTNPDLEEGLVVHWSFDGNDLDTGILEDLSGFGNVGILSMSTTSRPGIIGQALDFNGSSDFVVTPGSNFDDLTGYPFTFASWMRAEDASVGTAEIAVSAGKSSTEYFAIGFTQDDGTSVQPGLIARNTSFDEHVGTQDIDPLTWVHVVGVFKSATERELYINGEYDSEDTSSVTGFSDETAFVVGSNDGGGRFFEGEIDDARAYDRELSPQEISRLYGLGATTKIGKTLNTNPDLENGLVGHWSFDGPDLDTTSNTAEVLDRSGNGNDGNWIDHATTTISGKVGQAIEFDGVDDNVNAGSAASFDITSGSLALWVNLDSYSTDDQTVVNKDESGVNLGDGSLHIRQSDDGTEPNKIRFFLDSPLVTSDEVIQLLTWTHVVVSWESGGLVKMYVDGVLQTDTESFSQGLVNESAELTMGIDVNNTEPLNGNLDDVRIYNRVLSQEEITRLYQLGN